MPLFNESDRLRWVSDGQKVTADVGNGCGLPCVVIKACGNTALIRSLSTKGKWVDWEKWYDIYNLFPEITSEMRKTSNQ